METTNVMINAEISEADRKEVVELINEVRGHLDEVEKYTYLLAEWIHNKTLRERLVKRFEDALQELSYTSLELEHSVIGSYCKYSFKN